MLFRSTSPLGDRTTACVATARPATGPAVARVRLSVSDLPPPSFTAELNGPCVRVAAHSYNAAAIRRLICRRFGTEPEPTGSGPNQIQY